MQLQNLRCLPNQEVLFLDTNSFPLRNPEQLFDSEERLREDRGSPMGSFLGKLRGDFASEVIFYGISKGVKCGHFL